MAGGIGNPDKGELAAAMTVLALIQTQRYAKKIKIPKQIHEEG